MNVWFESRYAAVKKVKYYIAKFETYQKIRYTRQSIQTSYKITLFCVPYGCKCCLSGNIMVMANDYLNLELNFTLATWKTNFILKKLLPAIPSKTSKYANVIRSHFWTVTIIYNSPLYSVNFLSNFNFLKINVLSRKLSKNIFRSKKFLFKFTGCVFKICFPGWIRCERICDWQREIRPFSLCFVWKR